MSGIEVAGLVFGVVPVVVEILKSYSTARRKLTTFSRHVEVASDIQLKFRVAAANFNNDCRMLLQATMADPSEISEMMEDPTHKNWQEQGKDIEQRLRSLMQQDYELCQDIVTRLRDILRETRDSLSKLEDGLGNTKQPQHEFRRKIWHAFTTTRKENEYIRQLDSLDKWNKALSKLRKQRCKMQKRRNVPSACIIRKAVPRSYQQIRLASQQLGESIHESWSCTNTSHSGHQAKLSLDAKSGHDNVQLDVVVACQPKQGLTVQKPSIDVPIWLQIRTITSLTPYKVPTSPQPALVSALCHGIGETVPVTTKTKSEKAKSKKRVRINDPKDDVRCVRTTITSNIQTTQAQSFVMLDLKTTESVCCHVTRLRSSKSACQDGCVGFIEVAKSQPVMRFMFYDASKLASNDISSFARRKGAMPIKSLIQRFRMLQQLTLAHKLAEAVLQYHSTSWLPQAWTLQDVAYFTDPSHADVNDISDALDSLHLSNRFPDDSSLTTNPDHDALDLKHTFGIRNLILAKLGVALLEICAQGDITGPQLNGTPSEIIAARKLLDEKHPSIQTLGPKYLELVRKCIHCDFSCDDDLHGDALQSAVYTEVVCALQDMKSRWQAVFGA
ncbi:hypothetical protein GGP41_005008 [Bipolaris sorokiniana]|uniref:DUF7580 domain-containing protein n=2 Tax=Cochliobolus sativus TaxID=45130 RepID=A0A8H6DVK8_COCSA|nr:uncharacterized protein COCSADRAFT_144961 [Bipolaris sorokiniana ND90Pr]EMD62973.1 hypothetical protein COCSADRAFT_144961 [Bipolaris sorokiniana ND90Pr]KAF5849528.1 hypothetical protein GGP41_005008 [Bipolaris sorokiniana]